MDLNNLAPVAIPTLCRSTHFIRLMESLRRCTWAEHTPVYVAVDYPTKESHYDGWQKINEYLDGVTGFKELVVIRRQQNYGPGKNLRDVIQLIRTKCDRMITSEDDNEFSPNFLVYMNCMLERYKDDPRVIKICSYSPPLFYNPNGKNIYCGIDTPAYGMGSWFAKNDHLLAYTWESVFSDIASSYWEFLKIFRTYPMLLYMGVRMINDGKNYGDVRYSFHNLIHGTVVIQPNRSMSRNWGADGTGLHSGVVKGLEREPIAEDADFVADEIALSVTQYIRRKLFYRNQLKKPPMRELYLLCVFGYLNLWWLFRRPKVKKQLKAI